MTLPCPILCGAFSTTASRRFTSASAACEARINRLVCSSKRRALGRRAILLEGWGNLAPIDTGADCIGIGEINHPELFKHVAAIVHHGGAGTTHAAARAGRPQVIVPHNYDQYYWAQRVRELSVGMSAPAREQLTTETLIEALQVALKSGTARNAEALASKMERRGAAISAQMLLGLHS